MVRTDAPPSHVSEYRILHPEVVTSPTSDSPASHGGGHAGTQGYFIIFIGSAMCGNLFSFMFSPYNAVGASGALFGLIGAYIAKSSRIGALRNLQTALVSEPSPFRHAYSVPSTRLYPERRATRTP